MADYVQCKSRKMGEYDPLWCVRPLGHAGEHNYVGARDSEVSTLPSRSSISPESAQENP